MLRRSSASVRVAFLDKKQAIREVVQCARYLAAKDERVLAVGLFGSLARGEALPSSDADVLILLSRHPLERWFDRIPEYLDAFAGISLPVEPFPLTVQELAARKDRIGFFRTVQRELVHLAGDPVAWD